MLQKGGFFSLFVQKSERKMHIHSKEEIDFKNILRIKWSGTEVGKKENIHLMGGAYTYSTTIIFPVIYITTPDGLTMRSDLTQNPSEHPPYRGKKGVTHLSIKLLL